ncbi:LRR and PYD domains-containing 3-like protein [Labeo rohita]|uniref:LRR and PYD domains-containing 3-like protein n=1 Tax=Labeo rohita TaxID=84645 RepID=A0A498NHI0_LABRO|nr:LRR and PYD domains-containing 3-like protein [Labeo rohita]
MSSPSPELSCDQPIKNLTTRSSDKTETFEPRWERVNEESIKPSNVSMKSSRSLIDPPEFSGGTVTSDPRIRKWNRCSSKSSDPSGVSVKSAKSMDLPTVFREGPVTSATALV